MKDLLFLAAGLLIFLYGMLRLGEQVQRLFTVRIRQLIRYAVRRPLTGLLTGITATVFFQSSSAVTVLTIGMVSAGLVTFYQSLAIILGADIGTVLTVQLVVWKVTDLSPVLVVIGGTLWFSGRGGWKTAGETILYFGLIFFGLYLAGMATAPLKQDGDLIRFLREAESPFLGFAAGLIFTALVHSSLIPISLLVILAQQDLVILESALPIVFGANVGTTSTALLAAWVSSVSGRRTAAAHFLFKLCGAVVCMAALPWVAVLLRDVTPLVGQQIVFGHLLFNVLIVAVFIFFLRPFAGLVERIIPGQEDALPLWPEFLDERDLDDHEKALENVRRELAREILLTQRMVEQVGRLVFDYREGLRRDIAYLDVVVDNLRREIVDYLRRLAGRDLNPGQSRKVFVYTSVADDIERIGNHVLIIADLSRDKREREIAFTEFAREELDGIERLVLENLRDAAALIEHFDLPRIQAMSRREEEVDEKVKLARFRHLERFHRGVCVAEAGPLYIEMLIRLERISDHCENIAEAAQDLVSPVPRSFES
ncbi:MAG: Na/Pi cotransporter family protein [Syntrophales bacterium]